MSLAKFILAGWSSGFESRAKLMVDIIVMFWKAGIGDEVVIILLDDGPTSRWFVV